MQIREQHESGAEVCELLREGFLHLAHDVRSLPHLLRVLHDLCAGRCEGLIGNGCTGSGTRLHQYVGTVEV